ncbi:hypothetical protein Tco_1466220 [Tanacetum coccineum]
MANLSSAYPVYDEAGPSYDFNILSEPPDYSKENYLATFTPQKQFEALANILSQDLIKMKEEALKEQPNNTLRPSNQHFEGIQKALTKEIKEMKYIFEELEAEVDQNVVERKHDEIERKNLIAHDTLIADCFMCPGTSEAELSNLRDKIHKDNHNEFVKRFSNLEVNHSNLQLKYQNLKERFGNNPPPPTRETLDFDSVFVIRKMKASLQGKDNVIDKLKTQISSLVRYFVVDAVSYTYYRALDF